MTESRRARAALEASEARFRRLTESAQDITCVIAPSGNFTYISASVKPLLGYDPAEHIGSSAKSSIHADDLERARDRVKEVIASSDHTSAATIEVRIKHANGAWRWFEAKFSNCISDPSVGGILANAREITDRKQAQERVQFLAFHDNLTGLPNRMLLQDRIAQAISRAGRQTKKLSVLFVDLDNFKHVNDTLGHDAGDALLAQVASRLKSCVRGHDTIARQGGDEFIILLEDLKDRDGAVHVAQKVLSSLQVSFKLPQGEGYVTSSIGIAMFPGDGVDAPTLLKNADTAMYHSKTAGKNQYAFFTGEMNAFVRRRAELEQALRLPNLGDAFFLEFQPQVWLDDREVNGMEALVRWRRENGDIVSPGDFVPIAEEGGLIHGLGEYVIAEACHAASHWILNRRQIKRVAVNVTARELLEPNFANRLIESLDDSGLDPAHLELEIAENNLMQRLDNSYELLSKFADMGIQIAIDDFGVGYSNLAMLRRMPVSRIKLDRALVRDIEHDANAEAIARAIISMSQSLGLETVAVGIETERQLEIMRRIGCEMGQGFLFGAPKRPESI
jgi:diguanylate cyclase (GGDEF)-like protein/PAS domain S-box-containing protein